MKLNINVTRRKLIPRNTRYILCNFLKINNLRCYIKDTKGIIKIKIFSLKSFVHYARNHSDISLVELF